MSRLTGTPETALQTLTLGREELQQVFPAHLLLDGSGTILKAGPSLRARAGTALIGEAFFAQFTVESPRPIQDVGALRTRPHPMVLRLQHPPHCRLRGVALGRGDLVWLLLGHIPSVERTGEEPRLDFSDFSPADATLDMLLAAEMRSGLLLEARDRAAALETRSRAAEEASQTKSAFLAMMSHEIRTPMNGVLGLASVLAQMELAPMQRQILDILVTSGKTLMEVLDDILDISKIESGKLDLERAPFEVAALAEDVRALFAPLAASKGVALEIRVEAQRSHAIGDALRVRQILANLISNAIKFTDAGSVTAEVAFRLGDAGGLLEFVVADTGIGMAPSTLQGLFRPFVQSDSAIARRFGGTGLGLAITKQLCEQMRGSVTVESRIGRGSRFRVRLPLVATEAPNGPLPWEGSNVAAAPDGVHVLVAEDNATSQLVFSLYLRKFGITFDTAANGSEAILAWSQKRYDLILMDIEMPLVDGFEATREIRRREQGTGDRTPIVALSADALANNRERALFVGMDDFITKPVEMETFQRQITTVLARTASRREPPPTSPPGEPLGSGSRLQGRLC